MLRRSFFTTLLCGAVTSAVFAVDISSEGRSMPQAMVESSKSAVVERFLGNGNDAYRIDAVAWTRPEAAASSQKSLSAEGERAKPVQVGFPREIPASLRVLPVASLPWQTLGDGSRTVQVQVVAADAAGIRIAYHVDGPSNGLELRFSGSGRDQVFRSMSAPSAEIAWSPVLEGNSGTVELHVLAGFDPSQFAVTFDQLSHLVKVGAELNKDIRDIGRSGSCNIDIACVSNPSTALLNIAKATAKMVFTDAGSTFACTGTLLNSTSGADYFYSAAHCISSQSSASTLNTYWFFDAVACNSSAIPPYQLVGGGATLVVTDPTMDVTLLQLRQSPPLGAVRAAWNATVIPTGTVTVDIHHPSGDLKKFSQGTMQGYVQGPLAYADNVPRFQAGKDSFISVRWAQGTTEGGSSGSGVFTFNSAGGYYELRGGLEGGAASCENPSGLDRFSRMDLLYTKLAPFLQPSAVIPPTTNAQASMVEYWNPQLDFYFMTSREDEKRTLDNVVDGSTNHLWYRSGYWFKTDPFSSSTTSSISRYFIAGAAKSGSRGSHFYTALNSDRATISASGLERFTLNCQGIANGTFCNEGIDSYVAIPIGTGTGATCRVGEVPIYRVFRGPPRYVDDGNHRYLTNTSMYIYMVNGLGWTAESINFCAKP